MYCNQFSKSTAMESSICHKGSQSHPLLCFEGDNELGIAWSSKSQGDSCSSVLGCFFLWKRQKEITL